jgi:hypothetical protein
VSRRNSQHVKAISLILPRIGVYHRRVSHVAAGFHDRILKPINVAALPAAAIGAAQQRM